MESEAPANAIAPIVDVLGIGFGPANLSLGVMLEEAAPDRQLSRLFLEAKPEHVWHPDMLIEDSLLQVTVIKDLITVENPQSRFTFLCYLKEKGRLYDFLNLRDLFPTRYEFNDYLCWAAAQLKEHVRYGRRALRVVPADASGAPIPEGDASRPASLVRVEAEDLATGKQEVYLGRNLVLAAGGIPTAPAGIELGSRAFHSHGYLRKLEAAFPDTEAPHRFLVVGSGQSAAEIFQDLIKRFPQADVTATIRRFAYKPVDESDFTNRVFFPEWVDRYNSMPADKRRGFLKELRDVNYAVIDHALIRAIYQTLYRQKVEGNVRARLEPFLELDRMFEREDGTIEAQYTDVMSGAARTFEADGAVVCTGYDWPKEHPLLDAFAPYFERDDLGGYQVARDYRIESQPTLAPNVYLQGYCEDTHGISETVLSLLPVRAGWIQRSILAAKQSPTAPPVVAAGG